MSTNQVVDEAAPSRVALPPPVDISGEVSAAAERLGVSLYFGEMIAFTLEIFGSFSNVELVPDPEVPDWEHIIFYVPVMGSADEILE